MNRRLYEDADRYCMLWLGIALMAAYYFEFFYKTTIGSLNLQAGNLLFLYMFPVLLAFLFWRYFVPERGKTKNLMLSLAVFVALMYVITSFVIFPWTFDQVVWYASWGIGSAIITAGGAAMLSITTEDEAYSPGIMDVSKLQYGPPHPEPETDPMDEGASNDDTDEEDAEKKEEAPVSPGANE